uniref:Uncharacterized protein n=1 Tax=Trichuris muris TaxID=70415 RepID=A0A5S6QAU7_TRIMR
MMRKRSVGGYRRILAAVIDLELSRLRCFVFSAKESNENEFQQISNRTSLSCTPFHISNLSDCFRMI